MEEKPFVRIPRAIKRLKKYEHVKLKGAENRKKMQ